MKISELYQAKQNQGNPSKKTLSFEIFPPKKDSELKNIDKTLAVLCELNPDYISVTFGAGGLQGFLPTPVCKMSLHFGVIKTRI